MKLFVRLSFITLLGLLLFLGESPLTQAETSIDSERQLQAANALFIEGTRTFNTELLHQAKNKISLWLKDNELTANHKTVAQALRTRASVSSVLGEVNETIADYKRSNQYDPIAEVQLGICFLEKGQGAKPIDLKTCYDKAVQMFADKQVVKTDINYLVARILSGDKTAIKEYKNIMQSTTKSGQLEIYKMVAQEYFDKSVCQQILVTCEDNN